MKPTNPAWPAIKKELESLGIPITTAAPGAAASAKPDPFTALLNKLSTANDPAPPPAAAANPFASIWPSVSKELTASGIPISPAATLTPEQWLQMKGSLLGTVGTSPAKPFWASFMTPKADPPAGSGQPFWMQFIKPKPTSSPSSGFVPGAVSNIIPLKTAFIPAAGTYGPAPGTFIPAPVSNLLPLKAAFIPGGAGGGVPPFMSSYLSQMSDPPAGTTGTTTTAGNQLLPMYLAASMAAQKPGSPAVNPWASPYMGGGSPFAFMIPPPTPPPTPSPFIEFINSAKKDPKLSASLPWWTALIKEKPAPTPAPNPFLDFMKQYMANISPGQVPPDQSKEAAPQTAPPNPFLEFLKQYQSKTSTVVQPVAGGQTKPTGSETPEAVPTTPTPAAPPQVPADLWSAFLKSYMNTAGAASGTK